MIRDRRILTASCWASMLFLGVGITIVGAASKDIGLSGAQVGHLLTAQHAGFVVAVVVAGLAADAVDKTRLLLAGSVALGCAFLAFWSNPSLAFNLAVLGVAGLGIGAYEVGTDALLLDLHPEDSARQVTINHFFATIGMVAITAWLLFLPLGWRRSVVYCGLAVLVLAVLFARARAPRREGAPGLWQRLNRVRRKGALALFFLAALLAVCAELGTVGFLPAWLVEVRHASPEAAKAALVAFLAGLAAGRLLVGLVAGDRTASGLLVGLFAATTGLTAVLYGLDTGRLAWATAAVAGLGVSALFPLLVTLAAGTSREAPGAVVGAMKVAIPLGGGLIAASVSATASASSLQAALLLIPAAAALGTGAAILALRAARD